MYKTTYTLAEAADLLQCHKETLRRAIMEGSLQAARLGKGYRISRTELQRFWSERGGGVLFEAEVATPAQEEPKVEVDKGKEKDRKKPVDEGPHQLTLPIM